jgi:microfibrillar-associated protein 1
MSGAAAGRSAGSQGDKGRIEATKVKRYRPGQVPEWMKTDDQDIDILPLARQPTDQKQPEVLEDHASVRRTGIAAPVIVKKSDDPRLARLAATGPLNRTAALRDRHRHLEEEEEDDGGKERGFAAPQIVRRRERPPSSDEEEGEGEEEEKKEALDAKQPQTRPVDFEDEEDAIAARRAALKARLQEEERTAAAAGATTTTATTATGKLETDEEKEDSGSSEYETDSEEDDSDDDDNNHIGGHRPLAKPVFVPRTNRETIAERTALEKEAEEETERQRLRLEQRKLETKELLAARLAEEEAQEAAAAAGPKGAEDIVTDDEAVDENEEYQSWKIREMQRIGRDKEEREREIRDADEKERWKALTEEERIAYLQAHPKNNTNNGGDGGSNDNDRNKKKYGFLQKYYHRGAFFQTEATWKHDETAPLAGVATERDFSAPTGEDVFRKESLPEVMQVKNFGRRGRSKWTHLAAEDTTDLNAMPWAQNPAVRKKAESRMAGTEQVFTKPKNTKT